MTINYKCVNVMLILIFTLKIIGMKKDTLNNYNYNYNLLS